MEHLADERGGEDLDRRPAGHDVALAHDIDFVAVREGQVQIVHGSEDLDVQGAHGLQKLELVLDIQVVGGLIQDHGPGLLGERAGHQHPLALTSGERVEFPVGILCHAGFLQGFVGQAVILGSVLFHELFMGRAPHQYDLLHAEVKVECAHLGHDTQHPGRFPQGDLIHGPAVQPHAAARGLQRAVNGLEEGGFPAAVGTHDPHELPVGHLHVDVFNDGPAA